MTPVPATQPEVTAAAALATMQQAQSVIVDLTRQNAEINAAIARQQAVIDAMLPYVDAGAQPEDTSD